MNNLFLIYETYTNGYRTEILDIISLLAILCGILVITSKNPIVSVLFLIGLFASISCYLIMLGLSFIGLSYLIVYIGAVLKYVWKNVAALVQFQFYKGLFILIKFFYLGLIFFLLFIIKKKYSTASPPYPEPTSLRVRGQGDQRSAPEGGRIIIYNVVSSTYSGKSKIYTSRVGNKFYSTLSSSDKKDEEFYKWFVGFADGESNFTIVFQKDTNGNITGASFRFIIELHIDDIDTLKYIKSKLNLGNEIAVYGNSCKFTVIHRRDISKLISVFDKYNLNTTKYLDYLDLKKAFNLYYDNNRGVPLNKRTLIDQLLKFKNGMNKNRFEFNFPPFGLAEGPVLIPKGDREREDYKIVVSDYWLLGLIEAEGSFYLDRSKLQPVFMIALTKIQLPVIKKINDYLINNLGFDKYSKFKLENSSAITIVENKERNNAKCLIRLTISNINILTNYFIPYLENKRFITKKGKDFQDFKIICRAIYNGAYRTEEIKSLILKLSYTMNNFRLSSNSDTNKVSNLSKEELDKILNAKSTIIHLDDGRQLDNITKKEINRRWTNCVYEIIQSSGEIILASTLNEAAENLKVDFRTVKRNLDSLSEQSGIRDNFVEVKGNLVRRVSVFYP